MESDDVADGVIQNLIETSLIPYNINKIKVQQSIVEYELDI